VLTNVAGERPRQCEGLPGSIRRIGSLSENQRGHLSARLNNAGGRMAFRLRSVALARPASNTDALPPFGGSGGGSPLYDAQRQSGAASFS
jgi:hypothetical protein